MKQKFNKSWKSSKQPRKQRKYLANAPLHTRRNFASVNLTKDLRKKYLLRNIVVRKNDVVKVMRGKFKKKQGKVIKVDYTKNKVFIDGIQIKKQDGSKVNAPIQPSNLQIVELNLEDKKRNNIVDRANKKKGENRPKSADLEKK